MTTLAYRYGCPSWADLDDAGMAQLRLAHQLRNELVAIERDHAEKVAAIWVDHPDVAEAQALVDEATAYVEMVAARALEERVHDRSTAARTETKRALTDARRARTAAKRHLKAAKDAAMPDLRPRFADAKQQCRACRVRNTRATGSLYEAYVRQQGLGWGTFNAIAAEFLTSLRGVVRARGDGRPADLRFHRWTGEGALTVQVQRGKTGNRRRQWELQEGDADRGTVRLHLRQRHTLGPLAVDVPVVVHRSLPDGADVPEVRVVRRRVGPHQRVHVVATASLPAPEPVTEGASMAVRLGWAADTAGNLHVARIGSNAPLPDPPADIAGLVRLGSDRLTSELVVPQEWRWLLDRDARIRGHRDDLLDALRPRVVQALRDEPALADHIGATAGEVARWRAARKFARIAPPRRDEAPGARTHAWPADHPLADDLEAWRQRDKHLWCYEAHERDQVLARRKDAYRKAAAWLLTGARQVVVHGLDLADLRRVPSVGSEDTEQARAARANAVVAAPGELRQSIEQAATRRGITVIRATENKTEEAQ